MKAGLLILILLCGSGQVCLKPVLGGLRGGNVTLREIRPAGEIPGTLWIDDQADNSLGLAKELTSGIVAQPETELNENSKVIPESISWLDLLFLDRPPPRIIIPG
jgi:hypothetical protein